MADIVDRTESRNDELMIEIARLIEDHQGENAVVLYIGQISSWTDYFIIATIRSAGHLKGMLRRVEEYLSGRGIETFRRQKTSSLSDEGWILVDCGEFIIHLMRKETRDFYELERLWFSGEVVYGEV